ncbi:excinuclease ABC subunit UvrC [Terriglobus tenax]|uniref:excinuclease ABC subunit C n=1 Tax=Terriglobus tenax TaxID=1111115 RepID=UPI0021E0A1CD|nr:excinuclease ABC subunit C [Terriglobus tenax]
MPAAFHFGHSLAFSPGNTAEVLRQIPDSAGILALRGADDTAQPYLTKAANLRRRAARLLSPADGQTKRLSLRDRVAFVEWSTAGSDFESLLCLYQATAAFFPLAEARRRLKLFVPYNVRFAGDNAFPRVYVTNRLAKKSLAETYGPFLSRAAAERYSDAMLDLYKLRRCWEELDPYPEHPGCVYGEMKKCLAPCQERCTSEEYGGEATRVRGFLETHGESLLAEVAAERDEASAAMEFERAAEAHARWQKVKAAADFAPELVSSLPKLNAVLMQPCGEGEVAVFLVHSGCVHGPQKFSTRDIRAARAQEETGSSLFAQPQMLQPVPLEGDIVTPEDRLRTLLQGLVAEASTPTDMALLGDHLALLKRWYYRPEKSRVGRIFFADKDWPWRRLLNAAATLGNRTPAATETAS